MRFVKISDLHFSQMTHFLNVDNPSASLTKLANCLKKQQPDILYIAGDITGSDLLEKVKEKARSLPERFIDDKEKN